VRITAVVIIDVRYAVLRDKLVERQLKVCAQALHIIRRQPDDIKVATARQRTVSTQVSRRMIVRTKIAEQSFG
jgi:hypothetical protein